MKKVKSSADIELLVLTCVSERLETFLERARTELFFSPDSHWSVRTGPLLCEAVYFPRPQLGGALPLSAVMWAPNVRPEITVFYPNSSDGWSHLMHRLSKSGMPDAVSIRSSKGVVRPEIQELHYRKPNNITRRFLQLMEDEEGPLFVNRGAPFDFENLDVSPRDRISSREKLMEFFKNLGFDADNLEFWKTSGDAVYIFEDR